MPCFTKEREECDNHFERWIYILKNMEILERMPWAAQNAVFQRLADIAEVSKLNKEERLEYDHALKRYRDTLNAMTGAELKGIEKGRAEGEKNKAIEVARNLKAMGLSADDIVKVTGLTAEELEAL
jgi:predicted transposase/invertase (TIGR01784 family)